MANKWRTTVEDAYWVFVRYSINPSDALTEMLVRKITGIDKSVLATLITAQKAITTVTDPVVDNQIYSGTWTVKTLDPNPDESGNTAGSADIVQVLIKGFTTANPDNLKIARSRAYPFEQNENSWMYYERFKSEVTSKWSNIAAANIEDEYDKVRLIVSSLSITGYQFYYLNTDLYKIMYIDLLDTRSGILNGYESSSGWYPETGTYRIPILKETNDVWYVNAARGLTTELENPVIRECWYERNEDGTYNLYRTLETTNDTAIMRTRALQYAGMTLVSGLPILDDTTITIKGLNNETETVYTHARFRIGGDTYRVLTDATAVADTVTVSITPAITQATEDACDANPEQVQVDFVAL